MNAICRNMAWGGLFTASLTVGCRGTEPGTALPANPPSLTLAAKTYQSGFADSHDTYNGISVASNGKVYYVLCSEKVDVGGQMYSFNPSTETTEHLGDLTEACGEKEAKAVPQGKSHVSFMEANGKLYFATHIGYYSIKDGMETMGDPPPGYKPYPGGHFLAFDLATEKFEDLATIPFGEGILAMAMDVKRGQLFGLSWPTGYLLHYDLATRQLQNAGKVSGEGEKGKGSAFRTLCRSLAVDPEDGTVYWTNSEGSILRYLPAKGLVETVPDVDMRKDYFGAYDPSSPGHMGYNWRQTFWYAPEQRIYGVHGNSGYLFHFDPRTATLEVLERITSLPSQRSGRFDQFSYGYLGFALGPDGRTIHYLTGGPIYVEGKRLEGKKNTAKGEAKGQENLHLVTYDIPSGKYADQGAITLDNGQRPAYVNSIAVGKDGTVYSLSRITDAQGKTRTDLFAVRGPFNKP